MGNRLDSILGYVEELNSRSNKLIESNQETQFLANSLMAKTREMWNADKDISRLNETIAKSYKMINEFQSLHAKRFYLESNIETSDELTNMTSLDNLTKEYYHLMQSYVMNKGRSTFPKPESPMPPREEPQETYTSSPLNYKTSISDLSLKPLRCSSTTIRKKKSKYRISGIYNINPVGVDGVPEPKIAHQSWNKTPNSISENFTQSFNNKSNNLSSVMDHENERTLGEDSVITSPDSLGNNEYNNASFNSTPGIKQPSQEATSQFYDVFGGITLEKEDDNCYGKRNTLDNFYEYSKSSIRHSEFQIKNDNEIDINNHTTLDALSECSQISSISSHSSDCGSYLQDFDNFEKFLRRSRLALNDAFPNIPSKKSLDTIQRSPSIMAQDEPIDDLHFASDKKFHNPIERLHLNSSDITKTTVEPIYSATPLMNDNTSKIDDTSKILNKFISQSDLNEGPAKKSIEPSKSKFSLFKIPLVSSKKEEENVTSVEISRRNSIDQLGKVFSEGLANLVTSMKNESVIDSPKRHIEKETIGNPIPHKLAILKSRSKLDPITISNDIQSKRLPIRPPRIDNSHSSLFIGTNKTSIITHGFASVPNKPISTKISKSSLKDALSMSII